MCHILDKAGEKVIVMNQYKVNLIMYLLLGVRKGSGCASASDLCHSQTVRRDYRTVTCACECVCTRVRNIYADWT